MKTSKSIAVIGAALLMFAGASAQAQVITWGAAQTITTDTDVATNGTLVQAYFYNFNSDSVAPTPGQTDVVNGVTFTVATSGGANAGFTADPTEGPVSYGFDTFSAGLAGDSAYTGSTNYTTLLGGALAYTIPTDSPETLTLTGLTSGDKYELQFWANDARGGRGAWTITATDGNSVTVAPTDASAGAGQFAIGTFVASGATEAITFVGNDGTTTQVAAYQLRDLGVPAAPEPSTYALMGLGALALLITRRRVARS